MQTDIIKLSLIVKHNNIDFKIFCKYVYIFSGKEILVPLTGSMYVPGKLADANSVIVDIGTGYYAQKSTEDARNYFKRRVDYVTEQMEKIQEVGIERNKLREAAMDILEKKLQAHWETAKVARHGQRYIFK